MRRAGGLFERVCAFDNLLAAACEAERGKRYRSDVLSFNRDREGNCLRLARSLGAGQWQPAGHRHFRILEPKPRWISAAPYADRVVHHALCRVVDPVLDRGLVHDCWANRRGRGSHRAVLRLQHFAGRHRYALKLDIRQYFPSIDHEILKVQLARRFRERTLLDLMYRIIDTGTVPNPHTAWFPGDDLLTPLERAKGLPIGNLTSQLWANTYLAGFDHWVKQGLRVRSYLRFVDDCVLLGDDRSQLQAWREAIIERLAECRLLLHPRKCVIRRTAEGVPFLGYVVWPQRIRVRGEALRRFRAGTRRVEDPEHRAARLTAWRGHVALAGTYRRLRHLGTAG